jgi:phage shock protein A
MLNQIVLEMSNQLIEAKKQVAQTIGAEKQLAKQLEQETTNATEWERRAMMALRAGNEELAKEALARKKEHDQLAATYEDQWSKQKAAVEQLKKALRMLNDKIEEAKRKKNVLIARKKRAEAQRSIQETMSGLRDQSAFETFDRMAGKIDQLEAEAEAASELQEEYTGDTLASQFSTLEKTAGADEDLLALKRKMGLVPPAEPERPAVPARVEAPQPRGTATASATPAEQEELAAALEELEAEHQAEQRKMSR